MAEEGFPRGLIPEGTFDLIHRGNVHQNYLLQNLNICLNRSVRSKWDFTTTEQRELEKNCAELIMAVAENEHTELADFDGEILKRINVLKKLLKAARDRVQAVKEALHVPVPPPYENQGDEIQRLRMPPVRMRLQWALLEMIQHQITAVKKDLGLKTEITATTRGKKSLEMSTKTSASSSSTRMKAGKPGGDNRPPNTQENMDSSYTTSNFRTSKYEELNNNTSVLTWSQEMMMEGKNNRQYGAKDIVHGFLEDIKKDDTAPSHI